MLAAGAVVGSPISDSGTASRVLPIEETVGTLAISVKAGTNVSVSLSGETGNDLQYSASVDLVYVGAN